MLIHKIIKKYIKIIYNYLIKLIYNNNKDHYIMNKVLIYKFKINRNYYYYKNINKFIINYMDLINIFHKYNLLMNLIK